MADSEDAETRGLIVDDGFYSAGTAANVGCHSGPLE
jgi:hypothetical protein